VAAAGLLSPVKDVPDDCTPPVPPAQLRQTASSVSSVWGWPGVSSRDDQTKSDQLLLVHHTSQQSQPAPVRPAEFSLQLACRDPANHLIRQFVNHPLFPAMGMRIGFDEVIVRLGDLLVYAGFTIAADKAYGRPGLRLALALVLVFGAVMPTLSGLVINYVDSRLDVVIPAQTWFGPAAVVGYLWMRRRYGPERTMKEYLASIDVRRRETPSNAAIPGEPKLESEPVSCRARKSDSATLPASAR
jgi:hypothetical protein